MHRGMFYDDRHVLLVSCELEYMKQSDMLSVHVTTLTNNEETINVQNKLFCSANEFSNIDLAFPMHYLNLNESEMDSDRISVIKIRALRNRLGIKSMNLSIVRAIDYYNGSLARFSLLDVGAGAPAKQQFTGQNTS